LLGQRLREQSLAIGILKLDRQLDLVAVPRCRNPEAKPDG
jgi:hypothetical protein